MERLKNIHDVSAFYFFVLSAVYVMAVLFFRNQFFIDQMLMLMQILDLPFLFICLSYGGSTLALQLYDEKKEHFSPWVFIIFALCLIIFLAILVITFFLPNQL